MRCTSDASVSKFGMNTFSVVELIGTKICTSDQVRLGVVVDIEVSTADWSFSTLFVRLERNVLSAFNLEGPFVMGTKVIEVRASLLASLSDGLVLKVNMPELASGVIVAYDSDATEHIGKPGSAADFVGRLKSLRS